MRRWGAVSVVTVVIPPGKEFCPGSRFLTPLSLPSLESTICPRLLLFKLSNLYSVSKWGSLLGAPGPCQELHLYLINPSSEIQSVINSSLTINLRRGLQAPACVVNEKQKPCPNY